MAYARVHQAPDPTVAATHSLSQPDLAPDEAPPDALVALADRFRGHEQAHGFDEDGKGCVSGTLGAVFSRPRRLS